MSIAINWVKLRQLMFERLARADKYVDDDYMTMAGSKGFSEDAGVQKLVHYGVPQDVAKRYVDARSFVLVKLGHAIQERKEAEAEPSDGGAR